MNFQSIIVLLLVLAAAFLALRTYRKTGSSCSCGGDCDHCGNTCNPCHKEKETK